LESLKAVFILKYLLSINNLEVLIITILGLPFKYGRGLEGVAEVASWS